MRFASKSGRLLEMRSSSGFTNKSRTSSTELPCTALHQATGFVLEASSALSTAERIAGILAAFAPNPLATLLIT